MKLLIILVVFSGIYLSSIYQVTRAQYFEDPKMSFQKFEFDRVVRGGFNLSSCVVELFTCFETVRPDVMCKVSTRNGRQFEAVCSIMNDMCDEDTGYLEIRNEWYYNALFEQFCNFTREQMYT